MVVFQQTCLQAPLLCIYRHGNRRIFMIAHMFILFSFSLLLVLICAHATTSHLELITVLNRL